MNCKYIPFFLLWLLPSTMFSQTIHHWEAAVLAENVWRYRPGNTAPPSDWNMPGFNDTWWGQGQGGIGYGDGDDNTVISPAMSVCLRKQFEIFDTSKIAAITLAADYDDSFVAYLNGVEIARSNIGTPGAIPPFDEPAATGHEAQMYQGGLPGEFPIATAQLQGIWKNGTNTLAIQINNTGLNSSDLSAIFFVFFGITDDSNNYQPVPDWFAEPFESSNLPLLFINTFGAEIPDEPKLDAHLGIVDNGPGERNYLTDAFNGYDGKIGIEIRGSSSQMYPKKNYNFETRLENGANNNVPLLGLPEENDWVLHGPYSDKSLLRNVLSYHIGRQTGQYAPRTRWCELFINNQYRGLYVLTESIKRDSNRVDIARLKPEDIAGDELTGGYIFSADRNEGPETGWSSPFTTDVFYRYRDPEFDELMPEQKLYLRNYVTEFETAMNGPAASEVYDQYVDVPSWIDYWIATEIFKHIDNYKFSFFMYKKKDSNGGKIHFGPLWDLNLAYGNFDFGQDPGPEEWSYVWASSGYLRPFWILKLMSVSSIRNQTRCRWEELRQGGLNTDSLLQFIDGNAALIEEARIRNFERWPVFGVYVWPNSFVGNNYEEELDFLKNWLTQRLAWMDAHMVGVCEALAAGSAENQKLTLEVYPNPFRQEVTFHLQNPIFEKGKIIIFDGLGRTTGELDLTSGQPENYAFPAGARGLYFYKLLVDGHAVVFGKLARGN